MRRRGLHTGGRDVGRFASAVASLVAGLDHTPASPVARAGALVTPASRLARLCGQLLSVGFDGPAAPEELRARVAASAVGGVMLFRPNISSAGQVAALVGALRAAA